ncbi:hypothetical protein [Wolbachia endosymbiont (group A) of Acrocera orbiculus]|uniref:hypothetical protein n=1 Tax=Wolbachia endosymbiont (group A) of Acrocera orbiculus TaxID=2953971 RepID=UPI0022278263|nr:hypothetical protein [Wolbachia endosymbiont (group A) of Acrocera orbiculus]
MVKGILCNWLGVTELQESQKIDTEQFEKVFGALKEWQEAQKIDAEQFEKVFSALKDKIGTEQFQGMQEHLNGLQKKVETLAEAVADQEKTLLICTIATAVAVIAITSFVAFCIYQGVKCEREKEKNLSKDTPDAKLNNVDATDGTKKLRNDLKVDKHIAA